MCKGRAGERNGKSHQLQMQLLDKHAASQCCREQAQQFPMAYIPMLVSHAM